MDSMNNTNMVEIFSNGITTCVAPQEIADRFYNELTDAERTKVTDSFVKDQFFFDNGECWTGVKVGPLKSVGMDYDCEVENKTEGKSILCRIVKFKVNGR
jgi:hypothetical protein